MRGLHGAAALGRLLYLHDTVKDAVLLVWIYTHAEFETQPPKQDLLQAMLEAMELK
jgi:hypothetical protein